MFAFDKGRTIATTQDGVCAEFREMQDFSIDFKVNLKDLYGRGQVMGSFLAVIESVPLLGCR